MSYFLSVTNLSFTYETAFEPLFKDVSLQLSSGWTGLVGPNGCGKTTLLQLLCGALLPDKGTISTRYNPIYCEQRTDLPPDLSTEHYLLDLYMSKLSCKPEWLERWDTLSHGERKRIQLAYALAAEPDVLTIDEPTNHLDKETKHIVVNALNDYSGIGIIVSHDRTVLDTLCNHTLILENRNVSMFACNYSQAAREMQNKILYQNSEFAKKQKEVKKLKKRISTQRHKADAADKKRSKSGLAKKDHDAKAKKDLARLTGADAIEGKIHKQLQSKLMYAEQQKSQHTFTKQYETGISFDTATNKRWFPITIERFTLPLGTDKTLTVPDIMIEHDHKIGIVGQNGSGKSSFIKHLIVTTRLAPGNVLYIPQEIERNQASELIQRIHHLNSDQKGFLFSIIRRLGSDPNHLLTTEIPSPGETRKLLLAEGLLKAPAIIIMDEPTNHMDLPSIEALENALAETQCCQLLISHDQMFLEKIVKTMWEFKTSSNNNYEIKVG